MEINTHTKDTGFKRTLEILRGKYHLVNGELILMDPLKELVEILEITSIAELNTKLSEVAQYNNSQESMLREKLVNFCYQKTIVTL